MRTKLIGVIWIACCVLGAVCLLSPISASAQGATPEPTPNPTISALEKRINEQGLEIARLSGRAEADVVVKTVTVLSLIGPILGAILAVALGNRKIDEIPNRVEQEINKQISLKLHRLDPTNVMVYVPTGRDLKAATATQAAQQAELDTLSEVSVFRRCHETLSKCGFDVASYTPPALMTSFKGVLIWPIDSENKKDDDEPEGTARKVAEDEIELRKLLRRIKDKADICAVVAYTPNGYRLTDTTMRLFPNMRPANMLTSITDAVFSAARSLAQAQK